MEQVGKDAPNRGSDSFPRPDPTVLTTQQLLRELGSVQKILEARLDGMDKAIVLIQHAVDKTPTISEIYAEVKEKFSGIQTQFRERDARTEQTSRDSKVAVDAALQAAKELGNEQNASSAQAIQKSEAATTKQIDQLGEMIRQMEKTFEGKINDMKENLSGMKGHSQGLDAGWGYLLGAMGFLAALWAIFKH
jgi:DNA anti-recombination protein RmuC